MFAIYKKELKQYFHSMIGFVFLAFFIAIISIYTWANNFYGKAGNFETTLSSSTFLFVLLIPILTMRVLAEEKHQKTDQLLYTAPISIGRVIIGKYLALISLFGMGILFIGLYPLILKHYGSTGVQLAPAYSALLGFFLLGALAPGVKREPIVHFCLGPSGVGIANGAEYDKIGIVCHGRNPCGGHWRKEVGYALAAD